MSLFTFIIWAMVIVAALGMILGYVKAYLPWAQRKRREVPRDALTKLLSDLKTTAKINKEKHIRFLRFEGDPSVYRDRMYLLRGADPDPECYAFAWKPRTFAFTKVLLCPPMLCTDINAKVVSIEARGMRRVDNLLWVPVPTAKWKDRVREIEEVWQNRLDKLTIQQARVEFNEIQTWAWMEAAQGKEYRASFIEREERLATVPISSEGNVEEEGA